MLNYRIFIALIMFTLIALDTINTGAIIVHGYDLEANPIMRWTLEKFDVVGFVFVKTVTYIFMAMMVALYWEKTITRVGAHIVILVYIPLVIHQIRTILQVNGNI